MQIFLFIAFLLCFMFQGNYRFVREIETTGDLHFSDPMGNVYIARDNILNKYTPGQTGAATYTNTFLGNIFSIDVSDPLRILLFYKDHRQIVWVDNFLSEIRSPLWLDELGLDQAELVCSSSQGGFWVFNSLNRQLQYFSANMKLIHESPPLSILTGPAADPSFMTEKNRSLYLNIPGIGILVFDRFGNYSRILAVETPSVFQVTDRHVYYMNEGNLLSYDLQTAESTRLELPGQGHTAHQEDAVSATHNEQPGSAIQDAVTPHFSDEVLKAELQPGLLFIYTRKGVRVYVTER
jgi:hypothetical protein